MKSIGVTLQRIYLTKNCKKKKNNVRYPTKLSNILDQMLPEILPRFEIILTLMDNDLHLVSCLMSIFF